MESTHFAEIQHLSRSAALEKQDESGLAVQFLRSAAYSGAESPVRAIAQIADHCTGAHTDAAVQSGFKAIGVEQPRPAEFGSSRWMAQQVGGAVGMMVPFLALRAGVKQGAAGIFGNEALAGSLEAGTQSLAKTAMREAALSGATGLVYGSIFSPSNDANVGKSSFIGDRLKNGLADGATFAVMSAASPYVSKGLDSTAAALEKSTLLPAAAGTALGATLRFPLVSGMISGIPSGLIAAESNALKDGRLLATGQEMKEAVASMSVVGGAMGTASWLIDRAAARHEQRAAADSKDNVTITPQTEAEVRAAIEKAIKRMTEEKARNGALKELSGTLQDDLMKMLDETSVKRQGVAAISDAADNAGKAADTTRPGDAVVATDPNAPGLDVVLGASGALTTAHAGFLKALEEKEVPVARITGVSGGSLVATLFANHYSADQIKDILLSSEFRTPRLEVMAKMFHVMDPWNLFPYTVDFQPWLQDFVDTYHLKPQPNLRIVAADAKTYAPIVFEGTNYDLPLALAASTDATPAVGMKPVFVNGRQAVDGFYYHPAPADLCKSPAIVSSVGFVRELPGEFLTPWDYFLHLREMAHYDDFKKRFPDRPGNIIAETGLPNVAATTFGISKATMEKLIEHGREVTLERLQQPDAIKAIQDARKAATP
jgi:predicted acylesterase/phospholipase RssA